MEKLRKIFLVLLLLLVLPCAAFAVDYMEVTDDAVLSLGGPTDSFTIEFWAECQDQNAFNTDYFIGQWGSAGNRAWKYVFGVNNGQRSYWDNTSDGTNVNIGAFGLRTSGGFGGGDGTFDHFAIVGESNGVTRDFSLWVNGQLGPESPITGYSYTIFDSSAPLLWPGAGQKCWLDELRISSVARYDTTMNLTVPTAAFTDDADTVLLLHFDGADRATTTIDSSSNALTVTLFGNAQLDTHIKQFGSSSLAANVDDFTIFEASRFFFGS